MQAGFYQAEHENWEIVVEDRKDSVNNLLESLLVWPLGRKCFYLLEGDTKGRELTTVDAERIHRKEVSWIIFKVCHSL